METKSTLGGKRPGAGRPKGEEKKALGIRVPVKHRKKLTDIVRDELKRLISCPICGIPGKTKCTDQANCLNIPG